MCRVVTSACTAMDASCSGYSIVESTFSFRICVLAVLALLNLVRLSVRHGSVSQLSTLHGKLCDFFFALPLGYMRWSPASRECLSFMCALAV
jgi:hypothetical protein